MPLDILLMEDDPDLGVILKETLRRDGHRVLLLENGLVAMAHLHAKLVDRLPLPDLIIADVDLPGFKGLDILASLRRAGGNTPAIVMTAFASAETRARALDLGAFAVLQKPFALDELRAMVESRKAST